MSFEGADLSSQKKGRPPFDELKSLIELTGYEVISIGADREGRIFSGVINMQIAPKEFLDETDFNYFPQIPQGLVSSLRECTAQSPLQEIGNCQE